MGLFSSIKNAFSPVPSFIGDVLTGGAVTANKANEANLQAQRENNTLQVDLSNTAYQRAVKDMRDAGLNPMLAYSQGPASVPNTQAPMSSPTSVGNAVMGTASKVAGLTQGIAAIQNQQSDTKLKEFQADAAKSSVAVNQTQAVKNIANAREADENVVSQKVRQQKEYHETLNTMRERPGVEARSKAAQMDTDVQKAGYEAAKKAANYNQYLKTVNDTLGALNSAKSLITPKIPLQINTGSPPSSSPSPSQPSPIFNKQLK